MVKTIGCKIAQFNLAVKDNEIDKACQPFFSNPP